MKTTVGKFILDHLTDKNIERLKVDLLIEYFEIYYWDNVLSDDDIAKLQTRVDKISNPDTFHLLNNLKELAAFHHQMDVAVDELQSFESRIFQSTLYDVRTLGLSAVMKQHKQHFRKISGSYDLDTLDMELPFGEEPRDVSELYDEFANDFIRFLYEVSLFEQVNDSDEALQLNKENPTFKIENEPSIMIDSEEVLVHIYANKRVSVYSEPITTEEYILPPELVEDDPYDFYNHVPVEELDQRKASKSERTYYCSTKETCFNYDLLFEDFHVSCDVELEKFSYYLNKPLIIPDFAKGNEYDILKQLIHILTLQGFTENEQRETIKHLEHNFHAIHS